jgi:cold shock CspA family protein
VKESLKVPDKMPSIGASVSTAASTQITPSKAPGIITIKLQGADLIERVRAGELQFFLETASADGLSRAKWSLFEEVLPTGQTRQKIESHPRVEVDESTKDLFRAAYYNARRKSSEEWVNLAEFGNALKSAESSFNPESFGERSLGTLLRRITDLFEMRQDEANPIVYYVRIRKTVSLPGQQISTTLGIRERADSASSPQAAGASKLAVGKVHNLKLGFGFIAPDDGSENLFFHASDVAGATIFDLRPGDRVEYEPGINERGPCARKIHRLPG